jgi:hypothetical protein
MSFGPPVVFSPAAAASSAPCDILAPSSSSVILSPDAVGTKDRAARSATAVATAPAPTTGEALYSAAAERLREIVASMTQSLRAS